MIPRSPSNLADTAILTKIISNTKDIDGLQAKVNRFIEIANPIVDSILSGPFHHYTLHNRDHSKKLIHLTEHVLDNETLELLNEFECLLIIYSSYLHDMGMAVTQQDVEDIIKTNEYLDSIKSWPLLHREFDRRRELLSKCPADDKAQLELELADLHCIALSNYLRPKHANPERYEYFIELIKRAPGGAELFEIKGISFESELIDICVSHNLDVAVLAELRNAHEERYPRKHIVADHYANIQFIAAILRVTDILDFDFERTPPILIECLGLRNRRLPGSEVSLKEWEKHLSVQQLINSENELVVKAVCAHPAIESAVKHFCGTIEGELRRTLTIVRRNSDETTKRYRFCLPTNVRPEIRSNGYTYMDLALRLDESAIMSLLMGTNLYRNRLTAIRELIQNAVDACVVRSRLTSTGTYRPIVQISAERDEKGRLWFVVQDNGIGMDRDVLSNHFFRIGSSYYASPEFKRILDGIKLKSVPVVSKFGIGFLSVFMLADSVEIETKSIGIGGTDTKGRYIRVDRLGALAYVHENQSITKGTTIRIRVIPELEKKRDISSEVYLSIKQNILRPPVPLNIDFFHEKSSIQPSNTYTLRDDETALKYIKSNKLKVVPVSIEDYSERFQGRVFLFFVENERTNELEAHYDNRYLEITPGVVIGKKFKVNPKLIFKDFDGNRISVGGFRMIWPKLNRLLRKGSRFIAVAYDLDVQPGVDVEFDVARTRILDQRMTLRIELRRAILEALKDLGIYERISSEIRGVLKTRPPKDPFLLDEEILRAKAKIIDDEDLLERAKKILPNDEWPFNIHHSVATQLNISNSKAFNVISTLIVTGQVKNPNRQYDEKRLSKHST